MSAPRSILISILLSLAIVGAIREFFDYRAAAWVPVVSFLVILFVLRAIGGRARPRLNDVANAANWPVSGPISKLGMTGLVLVFSLSSLLMLLNPLQLVEVLRQARGNVRARRQALSASTQTMRDPANVARYSLPFTDEWCVMRGGVTKETSHSWDSIAQRYAYDFIVVDDGFHRHTGAGTRPHDYFCHGREILASADGIVVRTESRIRTAPFLGYGIADVFARSMLGNHVLIRHSTNEYGLYAHLVRGSVLVKVGEHVTRGQQLGRCGHTGHSTEPHLHFHIQDREDFFTAVGVPVTFIDLVVDGREIASGHIHTKQRVSPHQTRS